jgi:DNA helicase-4
VQLQEAIKELLDLNHGLAYLKRLKKLRTCLKLLIVGFLLWRDLERKISEKEEEKKTLLRSISLLINERLDSLREQIEDVEKSDVHLSRDDEERWHSVLRSFEADLYSLMSQKALDETHCSTSLMELEKFRQLVDSYNKELEKRKLRQELLKSKDEILRAEREFDSLFGGQYYFSKAELHSWKRKWGQLIQTVEKCVENGGNVDVDFAASLQKVIDAYRKGEQLVETRNNEFVREEVVRFKDLFDSIEPYPLTRGQREAVVVDEKNNLIVAGAGAGKTSTIIGKVGYLVRKGLASPAEVLLIAFNRDVVSEMDKRIRSRLGIRLNVRTYHSLGLNLIAEAEGTKPSVSELAADRIKLPKKISEFLRREAEDPKLSQLLNRYLTFHFSPYKTAFEFNSLGEYFEYLKKHEPRSLKGDLVKSFEECDIANFLYTNGISYEYEKPYEVKTADISYRQYRPDFFLPVYGIYIEHFGISRQGVPATYVSQVKYGEDIEWKRGIHRKNKTILIETYSFEKQEGKLLSNLEKKLRERNVAFDPMPNDKLFYELNKLGKVDSLALLLSSFLNLYRSSGKSLDEIRNHVGREDARTMIFLDIFSKIHDRYTSYLEETEEVDFNDMISKATDLVQQRKYLSKFKYILVDEFQDISQSRYRFLKSLLDQGNSKLFCVGDDWQSIYRFTGSDLSIMIGFQEHFDFCQSSCLEETFRFNDKLSDFSTKFILQNPNQIEKRITSDKKENKPAVTLIKGELETVLVRILSRINQRILGKMDRSDEEGKTVFIIGRYNYLEPENLDEIIARFPRLTTKYLTAHSSKGLEADYVIIIGLTSGEYGFPCQITDDPIFNLVLAKQDSFPNAEERRLFYVSVTRAKKHVYLVIDNDYSVSSFVSEIKQKGYEIEVDEGSQSLLNCPSCKTGWIVLRTGQYGEFYSCSNYPYCEYKPKACPQCQKGFLNKKGGKYQCSESTCSFNADPCPVCDDGYLVSRRSKHGPFHGCSNYPECSYIERGSRRKPPYEKYIS